jgi:hypothetical protein
MVVIKPKKLIYANLVLTPEEEILVRKGREELRGESMSPLKHSTMNWTIRLSKEAAKQLKKLPVDKENLLLQRLREMGDDPVK